MHFPKRIYGIENEFGVVVERANGGFGWIENAHVQSRLLPGKNAVLAKNPGMLRIWHSNGSCTYVDRGEHPEHATAECRSIRDVVCHNKAGEMLTAAIFNRRRYVDDTRLLLFKNNKGCNTLGQAEAEGEFGCHENYSVHSFNVGVEKDARKLIPFLITRQIIDGAGWLYRDGSCAYSQRALSTQSEIGRGTGNDRGIIHVKDTGDTGPRLHVIVGDANILEFAIYLKIGMTSIVLSLLESGYDPDMECINSVRAIQQLSLNGDAHCPFLHMSSGEYLGALEVQERYLEAARRELSAATFASEAVEAEIKHIIVLWEQTLNAIYARDTAWMLGRIDHATKRHIVERALARNKNADSDELWRIRKDIDIFYHNISDRTLQRRINKLWGDRRIVTDEEIRNATFTPPCDTRARMRGAFVAMLNRNGVDKVDYIDWIGCGNTNAYHNAVFNFRDPFAPDSIGFESFLAEFEKKQRE